MKALSLPVKVTWRIVNKCNLFCKHCSSNSGSNHKDTDIDDQSIELIANTLIQNKVFEVVIEGGEPFLYKNIIKILKLLSNNNIRLEVVTNGMLLTDEIIEKIKDLNFNFIQISLDAIDNEKGKKIRSNYWNFEIIDENIKKLISNNIPVRIATVLLDENYNYILDILQYAIKRKARDFRVIGYVPQGRGTVNQMVKPSEWEHITKCLLNEKKKYEDKINIITPLPNFDTLLCDNPYSNNILDAFSYTEDDIFCEACTAYCAIESNGDVIPCSFFNSTEFIAGNLLQDNLKNIWESKVFSQFRNLGQLQEKCIKCSNRKYCHGGCRAATYYVTGSLIKPDPRCWNNLLLNEVEEEYCYHKNESICIRAENDGYLIKTANDFVLINDISNDIINICQIPKNKQNIIKDLSEMYAVENYSNFEKEIDECLLSLKQLGILKLMKQT